MVRRVRKALDGLVAAVEEELHREGAALDQAAQIRLRGAVAQARQEVRWADAEEHANAYRADSSGSRERVSVPAKRGA